MPEFSRTEVPGGILYVPIQIAASATIVIGVANRKIVVLSAWMVGNGTAAGKFQTSTGPIDISGPAYLIANGGVVLPYNQGGWFQTLVGDSLLLNLNASIPVGGSLSYILV